MGNNTSQDNLASNFSPEEISRLFKRFQKLDTDQSGTVSLTELMDLPELKKNPLTERIMEVFDADRSGEVDFTEFISGMAQFSTQADIEAKLRFAFRIYDFDNDGYISNSDLFQVLQVMVGKNLKDTQLQQLVDRTMNSVDGDKDGVVSFKEFSKIVYANKMQKVMMEMSSSVSSII